LIHFYKRYRIERRVFYFDAVLEVVEKR